MRKILPVLSGKYCQFLYVLAAFVLSYIFSPQYFRSFSWKHNYRTVRQWGAVMILLLFSLITCAQDSSGLLMPVVKPVEQNNIGVSDGMANMTFNYNSFPQKQQGDLKQWRKYNNPEDYNHPEFGYLPYGAPGANCVEVLSKRKANERYFRSTEDSGKVFIIKSWGSLNIFKDGRWLAIDQKLSEAGNGKYVSGVTAAQVSFDVPGKNIGITTPFGKISFNNWTLWAKKKGQLVKLDNPDWSHYTIGEDGMYVTNIFKGIDAEIRVMRGAIKTNFVIRSIQYGDFEELHFRDVFNNGAGTWIRFSNDASKKKGIGELTVFLNSQDALKIAGANAYPKDGTKDQMVTMEYEVYNNGMNVVVPRKWINDNIGKHLLVIDPLVSATNSLAAAAMASMYNSNCLFSGACNYTLDVVQPAATTITDVNSDFSMLANSPCLLSDGAFQIYLNGCISPASGRVWICNYASTGACGTGNFSIMGTVQSCLPAPSCLSQTITFGVKLFRRCAGPAGCDGSCIGAYNPWTVTLTCHTVELSDAANAISIVSPTTCEGQNIDLSIAGLYGVAPYTYKWSNSPSGTPVISTNTTLSFSNNAGSYPYYVSVTDACNQTFNGSRTIVVNPPKTANQNIAICVNQLPYTWNGQTITAGGNAIATYTMPSALTGCDSTTTLNLTVNPLKTGIADIAICINQLPYTWNGQTITAGGNGVATYTMPSVLTGCDSTTTLNLTVNPLKTGIANITICADALPYTWNGISIAAGGTAVATYTMPSALTGCDSTTTLNLAVNPLKTGVANITICADALPYSWNGISVPAGGTAVATYTMPSALTGCDSTTTLNLTVNPLKTGVANITICADALPYSWNGISVPAGGTAVATYTMPSALTGCDSTTTLNLTVNPLKTGVANITICADALPYSWNGISVPAGGTGVATYTMPSALTGCDSTTTLNLTVNPLKTGVANITICADALPYSWNGISVPAGGTAVATYTMPSALTGCDSTTTLNLTVNPLKTGVANITICADALPYSWNGISIAAGGTAVATYTMPSALTGCDSTTTLNLTVNPLKTGVANITICADALPYSWNGISIAAGGTAVATYTMPSALTGCDSTTTLNLTVNPLKTGVANITICADALPYSWNGISVPAGGTAVATYTMPSALTGCDSTTTLNLTVNPLKTGVANITICADALPYSWNGISVPAGGTAVATYAMPSALTGCDSTTTLNLIVNPLKTGVANIIICADALPYSWNGISVPAGGTAVATYTMPSALTGCDSTTTLNLTVNPLKTGVANITICADALPYSWNGISVPAGGTAVATYTMPSALTGCDSTTTLNLTVNALPVIGSQPTDATILIGENTSFAITATGTGISYQWQVNTGAGFVNVTDGGVYSNATTATLNITNAPLSMNGYRYRCVVTGVCAPVATSNDVLLTVNKHPQTISFQSFTPGSTITKTYGDAAFSAAASASSGLTIAYSSSNPAVASIDATGQVTIKGAGSTMIAVTQAGDAMYLTAPPVTLFIQINKKDLQIIADNKTRPYGEPNPVLTKNYSGFVNGENQSVITEPVLATSVVLTTMPGTYPITLTGGAAANYNLLLTNGSFVVTGAIVYIDEQPKNQDACEGGMAGFTLAASAASPIVTLAYQWQDSNNGSNWQNIAGATGNTYITAAANSRYVRCLVLAPGTTAPTQAAFFTVNPLPGVQASKSNDLDCNLGSATLKATGAVSYTWSPLMGLNNAGIASPVASPTESTMYTVTGTDAKGCINTDSVKIEITTVKNGENVMPNAFSPNGDGKNDCFGIKYWGVIQKLDFSIFNRYGQLIFHSTTSGACWDGRFRGVDQPIGTYVYSIKAVTQCGVIDRKGTVTLVR
ncbi:MAG: gliding motility-associated C-terminal domain-containing protein [Chitinophagaceae bacterium]